MYLKHWQLKQKPFDLTPDPRFVFYSRSHEEALIRLIYTVKEEKGAMLLTGLYGCGKTILSRVFLEELKNTNYEVALINNPRLSPNELLVEMIYQLGGGLLEESSKGVLIRQLNDLLLAIRSANRKVVVVIDEAQSIENLETFEELRLLLNFQHNDSFLLNLILIGQSELKMRLKQLPQLKQRLLIEYHLTPLSEEEANAYINHRLNVAGGDINIFSQDVRALIFRHSQGIPRLINGVCDMALLIGFTKNKTNIDQEVINEVIRTSQLDTKWVPKV